MTLRVCSPVLLCTIAFLIARSASGSSCAPLDESSKNRLVTRLYDARLFRSSGLTIVGNKPVNGTCYSQVIIASASGEERTFYLSPDSRFLSMSLIDLSEDPLVGRHREEQQLQGILSKDPSPERSAVAEVEARIVVFSDFECPFCKRFAESYAGLDSDLKRHTSLTFKHFPLAMHSWAEKASEIAVCGQFQNAANFWPIHDFLLSHQQSISAEMLEQDIVSAVRLDRVRLDECMASRMAFGLIARDQGLGKKLGVSGTPTVFINGVKYRGALGTQELETAIRAASRAPDSVDGQAKTSESSQTEAASEVDDLVDLPRKAKRAIIAGNLQKAKEYVEQMRKRLEEPETLDGLQGQYIHDCNMVDGILAVRAGEIDRAKKLLLEAGKSTGSPTLNTFGPNMMLAKELAEKGEFPIVISYLKECSSFWTGRPQRLANWMKELESKRIPDFGANLAYD